jgi:hypothetical protein
MGPITNEQTQRPGVSDFADNAASGPGDFQQPSLCLQAAARFPGAATSHDSSTGSIGLPRARLAPQDKTAGLFTETGSVWLMRSCRARNGDPRAPKGTFGQSPGPPRSILAHDQRTRRKPRSSNGGHTEILQ